METERAANKYKQVEFMQDYVGDDFEAVISGVATFGFWAETVAHKCEGMVSINDLSEFDDFEFNEGEYALVGRSSGLRFAMGDKVKVQVVSANLAKRQIDFSILELPDRPARKMMSGSTRAYGQGKKLTATESFAYGKKTAKTKTNNNRKKK